MKVVWTMVLLLWASWAIAQTFGGFYGQAGRNCLGNDAGGCIGDGSGGVIIAR